MSFKREYHFRVFQWRRNEKVKETQPLLATNPYTGVNDYGILRIGHNNFWDFVLGGLSHEIGKEEDTIKVFSDWGEGI